mgnify:FL=1
MPVTPTVFERPIDQRLYDVLTEAHTQDGNVAEKISEAAALIADGADVNAKAVTSAVPDGFMLGCVLSELDYDNPARLAVIDLFFANGFDADKGDDLNGGQALAFLVNYSESDPDGTVLECVKTLLRKGCNPFVEVKLHESDVEEFDAFQWALDELGDVLMCDHYRPSLDAYVPICWCLQKFQNGDDYESVGRVSDSIGLTVDEIRLKGANFELVLTEKAGEWKYRQRIKRLEPFDSGIQLRCGQRTLFVDPAWGVFTDTNLPMEWDEQLSEPLNIPVKGKIIGIDEEFERGSLLISIRFENQTLVINDFENTVTLQQSTEILKRTD